jgi:hypothetical protein
MFDVVAVAPSLPLLALQIILFFLDLSVKVKEMLRGGSLGFCSSWTISPERTAHVCDH